MHDFSAATIKKAVIHVVGNKGLDEPLRLSENHLRTLLVEEEESLRHFFLKPFKTEEYNQFHHHTNLELNEAFNYIHELFLTPINFIEASKKLATHLFESSIHQRIKGGEFYVVNFENVVFEDEIVDAVGLFKTEHKSTFLNIEDGNETIDIALQNGIDLSKLDKGCIIFKTYEEDGFRALLHDQVSRGEDAQYWKEEFLGLKPASSEFEMTKNYMSLCKSFVMEKMPEEFEIDRTTQIELLNRSSGYFSKSEEIDSKEFASTVLEQPDLIDSFETYKEAYSNDHSIEIDDHFETSKSAVKQGKKNFKSILKLDKNFHIYVHGSRELIEHGFDEDRGMKFYKVFYNEERG